MIELITIAVSFFIGWVLTKVGIYFYSKSKKCCTKKHLISTGKCLFSNPPYYEYKCSKCGKIHNIKQ